MKESKSGFLAPSGLTWADFVFSELIITLVGLESNVLDKNPEIKEYIEKIKNLPELKEYYSTRKQ